MNLYSEIIREIENLDTESIPAERKQKLRQLARIISGMTSRENIPIVFICTHNSRRSILAQVWCQTLSDYYAIHNLKCYSGGTESTAVYPGIIQTLKTQGFHIQKSGDGQNLQYLLRYGKDTEPLQLFSKKFSHPANPEENFIAVMVCSDADRHCPFVPGASLRFSLPYTDPKTYDNTPQEASAYLKKSREISAEIKFLLRHLKENL